MKETTIIRMYKPSGKSIKLEVEYNATEEIVDILCVLHNRYENSTIFLGQNLYHEGYYKESIIKELTNNFKNELPKSQKP